MNFARSVHTRLAAIPPPGGSLALTADGKSVFPECAAILSESLSARAMLETCGSAGKGCTFPVIE
jgi:hypothetical protein